MRKTDTRSHLSSSRASRESGLTLLLSLVLSMGLSACGIKMKNAGFEDEFDLETLYGTLGSLSYNIGSNVTPSQDANPLIAGSVSIAAMQVRLYSDAACTFLIGGGTRSEFQGSGVEASVALNATTTVYGKAIHANGNSASPCTLLTSYVHDSIAPVVTLTSPTLGQVVNAASVGAVSFSGACSEEGSMVQIHGPVTGGVLCSSGSFSVSMDLSAAAEGFLTFTASQTDTAGNSTTTAPVIIEKDTLGSGVAFLSPSAGSFVSLANQAAFTVNGSCSEEGESVVLSGAASGSMNCSSGAWSFTVDLTSVTEGALTLTVTHADAAGNPAATASRSFTKDTSAPTVAITAPIAGSVINLANVSAFNVSGTCSENGRQVILSGSLNGSANCVSGAWSVALDMSAVSDGSVVIQADHQDLAGNSATPSSRTFTKDTSPPALAFSSPVAGSWVNSSNQNAFVITGTCSENGRNVILSGAASQTVSCMGGGWTVTLNLSSVAEGPLTLLADHSDSAGNPAPQASRGFVKDSSNPTISLTAPSAITPINQSNVSSFTISGFCSESGRVIAIGGAMAGSATCSSGLWSATLDLTAVPDGSVTFMADHDDEAGNPATQASRSFTKDTSPPTVAFSSPAAGSYVNAAGASSVSISGTCSENGRNVVLSGSASASAACAGGTFGFTLDLSALPEGSFTLLADHTDATGNPAAQASRSFVKDTTLPIIAITSPAAGSSISAALASAFTLSGTCSEEGETVVIGGAVAGSASCASGTWSATLDLSSVTDGAVTLDAALSDVAGNTAVTDSRSFVKDTSPPAVAITNPGALSWVNLANVSAFSVSGTCSENSRVVAISGAVTGSATCSAGTWSASLDLSSLGQGNFTLNVDHVDAAGNPAAQDSRDFRKDTIAPTVALTSPVAGSFVSPGNVNAFTISGSCSEDGETVVISGAASGSASCSSGAWSTNVDLSSASDGNVTLVAAHSDAAGNPATTSSRSFIKDTDAPTVAITSPAAGSHANIANTTSFAVSGSCSENGRDVILSGAASSTVSCTGNAWSASLNLSAVSDGPFTLTVNHSDAAANAAPADSRTFNKDTAAPTLAFSSPAAGSFVSSANQTAFPVSGSCSENGRTVTISGAATGTAGCIGGNWTASLNLSAAADGNVTLLIDLDDLAGNPAPQQSRSFVKDTGAPLVGISNPAAGTPINLAAVTSFTVSGTCSENGQSVVISGDAASSVTCSGGSWTASLDFSAAADGTVSISVAHSDPAGNTAVPASRSFTKDVAPPAVAFSSPASLSWVNSAGVAAFSVGGTCSENSRNVVISGAASATVACTSGAWSATVDLSAAPQGVITLYADHTDSAGNAAPQARRDFRKDTVAPTLAITSPTGGSFVSASNQSAFAVSGNCSEDGETVTISGDAAGSASCSSGAWSVTLDLSALSDGAINLSAGHSDPAGNPATPSTIALVKDASVPTIAFTAPADGSFVNAASVASFTVSGSCSENGRDVVLSGAASATVSCSAGSWSATVDLSAAAQGNLTILADHSDSAGNAAMQASRSFVKDTVAPVVAVSSPAASAWINASTQGSFTVSGTCSENSQSVVITGDASASVSCAGGSWTANLDFSAAAEGAVSIQVAHSDAAGNPAAPASRGFVKDTGSPSVAITSPAAGTYITPANESSFAVSGTCSENGQNIVISGAASATVSCAAGSWTANLDFTAAGEGSRTITANHSDAAGNAASPDSRSFVKDTLDPAVAFTSPASGAYINSLNMAAFTVSGTCSDSGQNVVISGSASSTTSCSGGTWSVTLNLSAVADGPVTLLADHNDPASNAAPQASRTFQKVSAPAGANSISIAGGATHTNSSSVTLTLHSDNYTSQMYITNDSGCATGGSWEAYNTSRAAWPLAQSNGIATVHVRYMDLAGNLSACVSDTIIHDDVIPTVAVTTPAAASYVTAANAGSFTVSGTCSENGQQVMISGSVTSSANCSSGTWSVALNLSAVADGPITVTADHADVAGNSAVSSTRGFVKDATAPTVAVSSPGANSYIGSASVSNHVVSGTCSENGRNVVITGDASATVSCSSGAWSANLDFSGASQGNVTIAVDHMDAAGNPATTASRTFIKDTVPPTVAITAPAAGTTMNSAQFSAFTVSGTCSEDGRNVVISGDASGSVACSGGTWSIALDFTAAPDGTVSVTASHSDAALNTASPSSRSFEKVANVPVVAFTSPAANSYINAVSVSSFSISGTCTEDTRNVVLSGAVSATVSCSSGSWTASGLNFSAAPQGNVTVYANHSDQWGNNAVQKSLVLVKDTVAPTLTFTSPAAGAWIGSGDVSAYTVSGTCSEDGSLVISGDASGTFACSGGTWTGNLNFSSASDGSVSITANLNDAAGNPAIAITRSFNKDVVAPTVAITSPAAGTYVNTSNEGAFTLSGTCSEEGRSVWITGPTTTSATCSSGAWSVALDLSGLAQGAFTVFADHSDIASNNATQASISYTKDTAPPTVAITSPAVNSFINASSASSFAVSGTCSENGRTITLSGAASGTVSCSGGSWSANLDFSGASEGNVTLLADMNDAAGNAASQASRVFIKDTTAPTVAISAPAAGSYINSTSMTSFAVSGSCSENTRNVVISGAASATVACSGGSWSSNLDFSAASDGNVTINVNHSDEAGNSAVQASRTFTKDTVAPTVAFTSPAANSYVTSANMASFALSGTCGDDTRSVVLSGGASTTLACSSGTWSTAVNLSANAEGNVSITATHSDAAGNSGTATRIFVKDTVAATVAISSPAEGAFIGIANVSSYTVSGDCSENGRNVVISGSASATVTCNVGSWTANLNFSSAADGNVSISVSHTDAAGNAASAVSRQFVKDTSAPTVAITSPSAGTYVNSANVAAFTVSGSCSEDGRSVQISGSATATATCSSGLWQVELNLSAAAQGPVTIQANLSDEAGNPAPQASRSFTKDTQAPTVGFSSPAANTFITSANVSSFTVTGTCSENGRAVMISGDASASVTCTTGNPNWTANLNFSGASEGTVSITLNLEDAAGNSAVPVTRSFIKDTVPASVAITFVTNNGYITTGNANPYAISGTCSENGRTVSIGGAKSASATCNAGTWSANMNYGGGSVPQGNVSLTVSHTDAAGNPAGTDSRTLIKDTTAPTLAISSPASNSYITSATVSAFTVTGTCSDVGQTVTITGATTATVTCTSGSPNWSAALNFSAAPEGNATITVNHKDAAGNSATAVSRTFIKDTFVSVAITSPGEGAYVSSANQSSFPISGTCSDNTRAVTLAGDVVASLTCSSGAWSTTTNFTAKADGPIVFTATHSDVSGNSLTVTRNLVKDTAAASLSISSPAANSWITSTNMASFTVDGTCSENGRPVVISGAMSASPTCTGGFWSATFNFTSSAQGNHTLTVNHSDALGNPAPQQTRTFVKDTIAATVVISSPAANTYILAAQATAFPVSGTCSDNGRNVVISGSANATVSCSSGSWSADLDFSAAPDGTVSINVNHSDAAGNAATQASRTFNKDTVMPTVAISSPATGDPVTTGNQASFAVSGTCSENGRAVTISGTQSGTVTCSLNAWTINLNFTSAPEGTITVTATHSTSGGNSATSTRTYVKDTIGPTLAFTSPAANAGMNASTAGSFTVSGTCSDNGQAVVISGAASSSVTCSSGSWSATLDFGAAPEGSVTLNLNGTDLAGNAATQVSRTFFKDVTPPVVNLVTPNGGETFIAGTNNTITWTSSDNLTGPGTATIRYSASGGIWYYATLASNIVNSNSYTWTPDSYFQADIARIQLTITDGAGNSTTVSSADIFELVGVALSFKAEGLDYSAGAFEYGSIQVGKQSDLRSITLMNAGGRDATGCGALTLSNTTDFSLTSNTCTGSTLPARTGCSLKIQAHPQSAGSKNTSLTRTCSNGSISQTLSTTGLTSGLAKLSMGKLRSLGGYVTPAGEVVGIGEMPTQEYGWNTFITSLINIGTNNAASYEMGRDSQCVLRTDGTVACSGSNVRGQLGQPLGQYRNAIEATSLSSYGFTKIYATHQWSQQSCGIKSNGDLYCWGGSNNSPITLVSGISNVVEAAPGYGHFCARTSANLVYCWGNNSSGQLGDGSYTARTSPTLVPGLTNVTSIASASSSSCAVAGGNVYCWGYNSNLELGDGTTTSRNSPVLVLGVSGASKVRMGEAFGCANVSGAVYCWGYNGYGSLGDGSTSTRTGAVRAGSLSGVTDLATGGGHTCALKGDGTVHCWGRNYSYQAGSTSGDRLSPTDTGLSGIQSITAGYATNYAVDTTGKLYLFGSNWDGQAGDGNSGSYSTPIYLSLWGTVALGEGKIAGGYNSTCVLRADSQIWCSGSTERYAFGFTGTSGTATFMTVSGLSSVTQVTVGEKFACALSGGSVYCWGDNAYGTLGDGTTTSRYQAIQVPGLTGVTEISAGAYHVCALLSNGSLYCWGEGSRIGDGTTARRTSPTQVLNVSGASKISSGHSHTCALSSGVVKCWGNNGSGELGSGSTNYKELTPVTVSGINTFTDVHASQYYSCGVSAGALYCWGSNSNGQLANGTLTSSSVPVLNPHFSNVVNVAAGAYDLCAQSSGQPYKCWGSGYSRAFLHGGGSSQTPQLQNAVSPAVDVSQGSQHVCVVKSSGQLYCWGNNSFGQLGDGTTVARNTPTLVSSLSGVTAVSTKSNFTCAVASASLYCWGENGSGQLGQGDTVSRLTPTLVPGLTGVTSVSVSYSSTCAVANGLGYCWGYNGNGELGDGTTINRRSPVQVSGISSVVQIVTTGNMSCAVTSGGLAYCWGHNGSEGRLGIGVTNGNYYTPTQLTSLSGVTRISTTGHSSCAIASGKAYCWGWGANGQLGNGSGASASLPTLVAGMLTGATDITNHTNHACAIKDTSVYCWGYSYGGEARGLGNDNLAQKMFYSNTATVAKTGYESTAFIKANGDLYMWGRNDFNRSSDSGAPFAPPMAAPINLYGF